MKLFFDSFLPAKTSELSAEQRHYLYLTALSKLLASLEPGEQKELLASLESSENTAELWLSQHKFAQDLLKEHIERSVLTFTQ